MDHMTHRDYTEAPDPHAGQNMSEAHASHDRHAGHSVARFRVKFWLSFALTIPVVFWSTDVQHWLGYRAPSFPGSNLIAPILGTVVFVPITLSPFLSQQASSSDGDSICP